MHRRLRFAALLLAAFSSHALFALNNADLIKLHRAGLDDETIILKMQQEPANYDLSTDGLIALKQAGVSDAIARAALKLNSGEPVSSSPRSGDAPKSRGGLAGEKLPSVIAPEADNPQVGERYFTRVSFFYERGKHLATNYGRGVVVPANTEVELISFDDEHFEIRIVDTSATVKMVNVPEYTGETVKSLASRYLSRKRAPLDKLPKDAEVAVETGQLRLGMTRELALLARGYPPVHETPSLEMDRWVYWSSRFVKHTIVFQDDRIVEGRGLY